MSCRPVARALKTYIEIGKHLAPVCSNPFHPRRKLNIVTALFFIFVAVFMRNHFEKKTLQNRMKNKICLGGVMVGVIAWSLEGPGLDPHPDQTKDSKIGICCFSAKHAAFRSKSVIMCKVACLSEDCWFHELACVGLIKQCSFIITCLICSVQNIYQIFATGLSINESSVFCPLACLMKVNPEKCFTCS